MGNFMSISLKFSLSPFYHFPPGQKVFVRISRNWVITVVFTVMGRNLPTLATADRLRENKDWWNNECQHLKRTKYQYRHSRRRDYLDTYMTDKGIVKNTCK